MKKRLWILLLAGLIACSLTACGGSGGGSSGTDAGSSIAESPMEDHGSYNASAAYDEEMGLVSESAPGADNPIYDSSKLILNGSITAEATDFDAAVGAIEQQVSAAGGYIESSSTAGSVGYRYAEFSVRVPQEQFEHTFDAVGENCHVTESSRSTENVSAAYYDAESRRTALETKRDRLLALLEKAESMEDIIALESALSDVQYEIESLSGTLRDYDRLISFSTIRIFLSEVRDLSVVQQEDSFLSDLKTAAVTGTRGLVDFVQSVILAVVYGWWVLLLLAAAALAGYRIFRRRRREKTPTASTPGPKQDESPEEHPFK